MNANSILRAAMIHVIILAGASAAQGGFMVGEAPIDKPPGNMPVDVNLPLGTDFTKNQNGMDPMSMKNWTYTAMNGQLTIDNFAGQSVDKHVWLNMRFMNVGGMVPQQVGAMFDQALWPTLTTSLPNAQVTPISASVVASDLATTIWIMWNIHPCPLNETVTIVFPNVPNTVIQRLEVYTTCPEPASVVLMGIGLATLAGLRVALGWIGRG